VELTKSCDGNSWKWQRDVCGWNSR